jgi:hypothetical protein
MASLSRARYDLRLMNAVTQFLSALGRGDPHAVSRLLPLVYDELRNLAAQRMARFRCPAVRSSTTHGDARGEFHAAPKLLGGE